MFEMWEINSEYTYTQNIYDPNYIYIDRSNLIF